MSSIVEALANVEVIDLGRPYVNGMPQSPNHPSFRHCLDRRHGDRMRTDGASAAADLITMGAHVGTHVDALAHVSQDGHLQATVDLMSDATFWQGLDAPPPRIEGLGGDKLITVHAVR